MNVVRFVDKVGLLHLPIGEETLVVVVAEP